MRKMMIFGGGEEAFQAGSSRFLPYIDVERGEGDLTR